MARSTTRSCTPSRLCSRNLQQFGYLALFTILALSAAPIPAHCNGFFMPNTNPLSSYFMSSFPGAFGGSGGGGGSTPGSSSSSAPPPLPSSPSAMPSAMPFIAFSPHQCEFDGNDVVDFILDRMRINLPEEKIVVPNGAITIYDAQIKRFAELARLRNSCARKLDPMGSKLLFPFEAEIRTAHVQAKLKYNMYVTEVYGDYAANFSHIRMNGTLEADLHHEYLTVADFNITSSEVLSDQILFGYVPKWILDWIRSYFDNDNTALYQTLAKQILQKETNAFRHFDMVREVLVPGGAQGRAEEEILNRI